MTFHHSASKQHSSQPRISDPSVFDSLFYRRLQHIAKVLDEDAVEMENAKNYFRTISETKGKSIWRKEGVKKQGVKIGKE